MPTYEDYKKINKSVGPTRNYYINLQPNFFYTDGIKMVADTFQCYWIINTVESFSDLVRQYREENTGTLNLISDTFDVVTVSENNQSTVEIIAIGYNDDELEETQIVVATQKFAYTDLPEGEYRFFLTYLAGEKLLLCLLKEF